MAMTVEKRHYKRVSVELPVKVYLFDNKKKTRLGQPLEGRVGNFSPTGAALNVTNILINNEHLFYACQDKPDMILELLFDQETDLEKAVSVPATPVFFDRDLDSEKKQFVVGLKFLLPPQSEEIKSLCHVACHDEMRLVSLWKKLFQD